MATRASEQAKDVLLYFGINPYFGQENLAFAPNWPSGHTYQAMVSIKDQLVALYNTNKDRIPAGYAAVKAALVDFARRFIIQDLPGMANAGGGQ